MLTIYFPDLLRRIITVVVGFCLVGLLFCRLWFQVPDFWWFFIYERHQLHVLLAECVSVSVMERALPEILRGNNGDTVRFFIGNPRFKEDAGQIPSNSSDVRLADEIWIYRFPVETPFLVGFKNGRCKFARVKKLADNLEKFDTYKASEIKAWVIGKSKFEIESKLGRCALPFRNLSPKDWWRFIKSGQILEEPDLWFYFHPYDAIIFEMRNGKCVATQRRSFFY